MAIEDSEPPFANVLSDSAILQFQLGEYSEAHAQWQRALEIYSDAETTSAADLVECLVNFSSALSSLGKDAEASQLLMAYVEPVKRKEIWGTEERDRLVNGWIKMATVQKQIGAIEMASASLHRAAELAKEQSINETNTSRALVALSNSYHENQNFSAAISAAKDAITYSPIQM